MKRRGRFLLTAVCAVMFATVGASGAAATPRPIAATTASTQTTVLAPSAANTMGNAPMALPGNQQTCVNPGQVQTTGPSGPAATPPGATQPTVAPIVPRPCADSATHKTPAELIAAAAHARFLAGIEVAPGHRPTKAATVGHKGKSRVARKIVVKPSAATSPATAGPSIAGTITDASSAPLNHIYVEVDLLDGTYTNSQYTNSSGQYSIALPANDYNVWLSDEAGTYASGYYTAAGTSHFTYDWAKASTVTVTTDPVVVNVALPLIVHITGTVTNAATAAIPNIFVEVLDAQGNEYSSTYTDGSGSYAIEVDPGVYSVRFLDNSGVYASGYYRTSGFTYNQGAATKISVSLIDVTANIVLPPAIHITGVVTTAGGPADNIEVDLKSSSGDWLGFQTTTDSSGNYSLAVGPGTYLVWFTDNSGVYATGYYSASGFTYSVSAASKVIVSSADVLANLLLPGAIHISGKVTKSGGVGLAGIDVYADNTSDYYSDTTAADGTYSIVVAPGTYTLEFDDGAGVYASGFYMTSGFTYDSASATVLTVGLSNVTGKNIVLPTALHIKGKVTGPGGADLTSGIVVSASSNTYGSYADVADDGTFSVAVRPGSYTLYFRSWIGNDQTYGSGYYSTAGFTYFDSSATAVTVTTADVSGKNVALPLSILISGTVTDAAADPLSEIDVYADSANYSAYMFTQDGTYSVAVAPGVSYTLNFVDDSGTYASGYYTNSGPSNFTYDAGAASPVAVASTSVSGKNVILPDAIHVTGTVTNAADEPLSGIEVDLNAVSSARAGVARPSATTSGYSGMTLDDGTYSIAVAPGTYEVYFRDYSQTYASGYYSKSGFTPDESAADPVTVSTDDVPNIDVTLPPAVHIMGTVTATGGAPLQNIEADVYVGGSYYGWTLTDAAGNYSVVVSPGDYTVYFYDSTATYGSGYYTTTTTSNFTYDSSAASTVAVSTTDATANVTLPVAIRITGKVTKSGGAGLPGIWVTARGNGYSNGTYTAADGTYGVGVAPNTSYTLSFYGGNTYGSGYYSTTGFTYTSPSPVAVASSDVTGKNVTLPLAIHIKGRVTRSGGVGLSDVLVYALTTDGMYGNEVWTAADGTYSVTVAPGTYTIWFKDYSQVYGTGYYSTAGFTYFRASASKVGVSSTDVTGKNVTLPSAIHITGKVTKSGGVGLSDIEVGASSSSYSNYTWTAADGTYSVAVAPGSYTLEFYDNSSTYGTGFYSTGGFVYSVKTASLVTVSSTDATGKDVVLPKAVHISGNVTDNSDDPLGNIEVDAASTDGTVSTYGYTDKSGNYSIELAPATYTLWFKDRSGTNGAGYYSAGGFVYDSLSATPVLVGAGDVTGINVKMVPASFQVFPASTYTAIAPRRILDTRATANVWMNMGLSGAFTAGAVRTFQVAGAQYVGGAFPDISGAAIPWNASAVTGNLTIVNANAPGVIALGPTMTPTGDTTTINFVKGDARANNVTVGLGASGTLAAVLRSTTVGASTDLIFDITGYFMPDLCSATYHAVAPGRVLDSRATGAGHVNIGLKGKFASQSVRTFSVAGVVGLGWTTAQVPSNATAVTGNLTTTNATSTGFVAVGPTLASIPSTSTINVVKGSNLANGVTVALLGGKLQAVWNGAPGSSIDVIFDVTGYFTPDISGNTYHPIVPFRSLDTSINKGLTGPFVTLTSRTLPVAGVGAVPADAAGISGNLTIINPSTLGYAFISPDPVTGAPKSSTVNVNAHQDGANGFDVPLSSGHVALVWVGSGVAGSNANLQLDITGYWK